MAASRVERSGRVERIRLRIYLSRNSWIGPGKIELLETLQQTGSLTAAARQMGLSYRRAWLLLDALNAAYSVPVTEARTGGAGGGGVRLTEFGARLVRKYRSVEARALRAARSLRIDESARD